MKTIIVEKDKFLFDKFAKEILTFLEEIGCDYPSPYNFIFKDSDEEWSEGVNIRNFMEELEEGEGLYFPFTTTGGSDTVGSFDGTEYASEDAGLGEIDTYGFHIELKDDKFVIQSALFMDSWRTGPGAMVLKDDDQDYAHFDGPMEKFINKFIK